MALLSSNFRVAKLKPPGQIDFIFIRPIFADFKTHNYNYQNMQREYQHKSAPTSAYLRKYKSLILQLYYLPILELQSLDHLTAAVWHRKLLSPTTKFNIHRAVQRRSHPTHTCALFQPNLQAHHSSWVSLAETMLSCVNCPSTFSTHFCPKLNTYWCLFD